MTNQLLTVAEAFCGAPSSVLSRICCAMCRTACQRASALQVGHLIPFERASQVHDALLTVACEQPSRAGPAARALAACCRSSNVPPAEPSRQWWSLLDGASTGAALAEAVSAFTGHCRKESSETFVDGMPRKLLLGQPSTLHAHCADGDAPLVQLLAVAQRISAFGQAEEHAGAADCQLTLDTSAEAAAALLHAAADESARQSTVRSTQRPGCDVLKERARALLRGAEQACTSVQQMPAQCGAHGQTGVEGSARACQTADRPRAVLQEVLHTLQQLLAHRYLGLCEGAAEPVAAAVHLLRQAEQLAGSST